MFTFLFGEYRRKVAGQYRMRIASIHLGLLSVVFFAGAALSLPTYLILDSKLKSAILEKSAISVATVENNGSVEKDINSIKAKLQLIKADNEEILISSVLEKILSRRGDDIKLTSITLKRKAETGSITLGGVAPSRDSLVAFSKRLQSEVSFTNVNLPVASLAKSKDVPFSIIIDSKI